MIFKFSVSPRWAVASYSCILGKFELNSEVQSFNWYLQVNGSDYEDENRGTEPQQVNVVGIFKYPQVSVERCITKIIETIIVVAKRIRI